MTGKFAPKGTLKWLQTHASYSGDDCLTWPFYTANGYGMFGYRGKLTYAHRFMCELIHGPAPSRNHVASHSCGRGHLGCVNPRHLEWKTYSANQLDRARHGTKNCGARGKLTPEAAAQIRALAGIKTQREMAEMFGVSRSQISWVVTGKAWKATKRRKFFSREVALDIRGQINAGRSLSELARAYECNWGTIQAIRDGTHAALAEGSST